MATRYRIRVELYAYDTQGGDFITEEVTGFTHSEPTDLFSALIDLDNAVVTSPLYYANDYDQRIQLELANVEETRQDVQRRIEERKRNRDFDV